VSGVAPLAGAVQPLGTSSPTSLPSATQRPTPTTTSTPSVTASPSAQASLSPSQSGSPSVLYTTSPSPSAVSCRWGFYCYFDRATGLVSAPCPAGRYGNSTQLRTPDCSGPCPPGHFCPPGTHTPGLFVCPPGTQCAEGSARPANCTAGWACAAPGTADPALNASAACKPGYYCPGNLTCALPPLPCAYDAADAYALGNSWCPPPAPGANASAGIAQCPANGLLGSSSTTQVPCPAGRYNSRPQSSSPDACLPCSLGTYSFDVAWAYPLCFGTCVAGKYGIAEGATTEPAACEQCAAGYFSSVPGSSACQPCSLGTFAAANGTSL
jgi:hypothetical protein